MDRDSQRTSITGQADHALRFAMHYGTDLVGAFVVGDFARDLVERISPSNAARTHYPNLAVTALREAPWGSSPGGEQPKFAVPGRIVKFSPTTDTPSGARWADLLAVEHLAHEVLQSAGVAAANSVVLDVGERRFLEVERTAPLVREGRLTADDHTRVAWLEAFGHLIANTDMHPGNLSFQMRGTTLCGISPVYDMLPMYFAPRHGELPGETYLPTSQREAFPASAVEAARSLWERVVESALVSDAFKRIAKRQIAVLP